MMVFIELLPDRVGAPKAYATVRTAPPWWCFWRRAQTTRYYLQYGEWRRVEDSVPLSDWVLSEHLDNCYQHERFRAFQQNEGL